MKDTITAGRYAQAFFDHAEDLKQLDQANADMVSLQKLLKTSSELQYLIHEPTIDSAKRIQILEETFKKHLHGLTFTFLLFLEEKRRQDLLLAITNEWEKIYLNAKEILRVKATSARPLSEATQKLIVDQLNKKFKKDVKLDVSVNPQLLGGFRLQVGDTVHDHSISYQLEKFKKQYLST